MIRPGRAFLSSTEVRDYVEALEEVARQAIIYRGLMRTGWDLDRPLDEALAKLPPLPEKVTGGSR